MRGTKLKIGIDVDDVLLSCIPYITKLVNEEIKPVPPLSVEEFTSWGIFNSRTEMAYRYFSDSSMYENQPEIPGAGKMLKELCQFADVFIISATQPEFMSARAKRIMELFPEVPKENIMLGSRKDIASLDILFDDGGHNILSSGAKFPVLMRQPWNRDISGRLTANNFEDFLEIVRTIRQSYIGDIQLYDMICLVGPSGSGKHEIVKELVSNGGFSEVKSYTTGGNSRHKMVTEEEFQEMSEDMFETTYFAGCKYGLRSSDISRAVKGNTTPVIITDICGAMTLRRTYHPLTVYCQRSEKEMLHVILGKQESEESTISRIMSMRTEMDNEALCDISVAEMNPTEAVDCIIREMNRFREAV